MSSKKIFQKKLSSINSKESNNSNSKLNKIFSYSNINQSSVSTFHNSIISSNAQGKIINNKNHYKFEFNNFRKIKRNLKQLQNHKLVFSDEKNKNKKNIFQKRINFCLSSSMMNDYEYKQKNDFSSDKKNKKINIIPIIINKNKPNYRKINLQKLNIINSNNKKYSNENNDNSFIDKNQIIKNIKFSYLKEEEKKNAKPSGNTTSYSFKVENNNKKNNFEGSEKNKGENLPFQTSDNFNKRINTIIKNKNIKNINNIKMKKIFSFEKKINNINENNNNDITDILENNHINPLSEIKNYFEARATFRRKALEYLNQNNNFNNNINIHNNSNNDYEYKNIILHKNKNNFYETKNNNNLFSRMKMMNYNPNFPLIKKLLTKDKKSLSQETLSILENESKIAKITVNNKNKKIKKSLSIILDSNKKKDEEKKDNFPYSYENYKSNEKILRSFAFNKNIEEQKDKFLVENCEMSQYDQIERQSAFNTKLYLSIKKPMNEIINVGAYHDVLNDNSILAEIYQENWKKRSNKIK